MSPHPFEPIAAAALSALLDGLPVGVVLVGADGGVLSINEAFFAVTGIEPGDRERITTVEALGEVVEFRDAAGVPLPSSLAPAVLAGSGGRLDRTPMIAQPLGGSTPRPVMCSVLPVDMSPARGGAIVLVSTIDGATPDSAALEESQAALRVLVADRERVQAEERRRIARDLHDDLQQSLSALNMRLGMAEEALGTDVDEARQWLDEAQRNVIDAARATRRIIDDLRPQGLYHRPLIAALGDLAAAFENRTGVECSFASVPPDMSEPAEEVADCIYRVAQESLTNIAKHAEASEVSMVLERDADGAMRLSVADNGRGLDVPTARYRPGSYGLVGMTERVRALNGEMRISGESGQGTTVVADIPSPLGPTTGHS